MIEQLVEFDRLVRDVCEVAKKGLIACYGSDGRALPYTRLPSSNWWGLCPAAKAKYSLPYTKIARADETFRIAGKSVRYAAITQVGISRWLTHHPEDADQLPDLWSVILKETEKEVHVSDLSLTLWAGVISDRDGCDSIARLLREKWSCQAETCNAYELAWAVQACATARRTAQYPKYGLDPIAQEARDRLLALFQPTTRLFRRHYRKGVTQAVGRRIACFADQVYPILALSTYGSAFGDQRCIEVAGQATEEICRLQGALGQWRWHYDTIAGGVCEEYPVYSVHQDGMAPMAILASDRATGLDHSRNIELGLRWIVGNNELGENLLKSEDGIVWRDIRRRELPRVGRFFRGVWRTAGLQSGQQPSTKTARRFCINYECRPYHLGWVLYAWADRNVCV